MSERFMKALKAVFGDLSWAPPAWLGRARAETFAPGWRGRLLDRLRESFNRARSRLQARAQADPRRFRLEATAVAAGLILPALFAYWYWHRPQYVRFTVTGTSPGPTKAADFPAPDSIHVDFGGSAARLDKVGKVLSRGISISPNIPGIWRWDTDRRLTFTPKTDWAVGQDYVVRLDRSLFPDFVHLERYEHRFKSAPFSLSFTASEFYQDPTDPKLKKIVATVSFSHPVDPAELEKRVSLQLAGQGGGFLGIGAKNFPFTVTYDKFKTAAHIHSAPVDIPMNDTYMVVRLDGGVRAGRGGAGAEKLERQIPVPGMYNYFRIQAAELTLVRNERYEPERALIIQATAGALEDEIQKNLSVVELPKDLPEIPGQKAVPDYQWYDASRIGPEVLALSKPVALEPLPTDREYATSHGFKLKATPGRFLFIRVKKGVRSYGGYVLAKDFEQVSPAPEFPKEVKIMYDGAILSLSGQKKVSVISRDIDAIRFEAARVLPNQINHLVSQSQGLFRNPQFNYNFGPDDISEKISEVRALNNPEPGRSGYSSFDLSDHLTAGADGGRRGLFFFKAEGWDPIRKRPLGVEDRRLILVTDLGLLVKDLQNGSHEVFAQSIADGSPVAGAEVQILGRNGLPVLSAVTNETGRAAFPSFKGFEREKAPTVYVARRGGDLAFLPYDWGDRRLNFSRFDVGGAQTPGAGERLQAYLFSDRGVYRPGDEFRIGLVVKPADWTQVIAGVPLEASITDARGLEVHKQKILLSPLGFEELRYATEDTSPTGVWQVGIYVVKDGRRAALLGSTQVRVEEFLPDRLHIATRLSKERLEGWVSPEDLKATVLLKNLFGTPATGRRVRGQISLSPALPAFRALADYAFHDPQRAKRAFTEPLQELETDAKGEAEFGLDLGRFEKATYRLTFTGEGYEAGGGRSVVSESSVLVSPREYLVGYKPDGDLRYVSKGGERAVHIIAVDPALKKRAVSSLKGHIIELRYVSVLVRQENGTYKYESVLKEIPLSKKDLAIPEPGLNYALPTTQPGDFALVLRDATDTELCRVPFSVAGAGNLTRSLEKNAELKIQLSKADYSPGEEIELQIVAPYSGAGLITVERDRVYAHKWFRAGTTASTQRIRIPADLEGNGYVVVSFVRAMDSPEIFMSPLSYGVAPFSVSRERRTNPLTLETPELTRPGQPLRIRYRAEKPGKIVVFAVDEGILQVAGYKTPDPLGRFFEKRALEVGTFQILDLILPEFKMLQSLSAPGGDMGREALGKNLNPFKRKRDKPVVYWSGIVNVDSAFREVVYSVPDHFNGSLRVMAVAVAQDSIGVAERKTLVRGHFVLTPNAPVVAAPGDEFEVSVGVSNQAEGSGPEAELTLDLKTSEHLKVVGEASRRAKVPEGREAAVVFRLRAADKLGSGNMTFTAALGEKRARASVGLSVRPPVPYVTTVAGGILGKGRSDVKVDRRMYTQYRELEAAVSPLPLGLARGLDRYLSHYPYLCTEQLVSQSVPALVLRARPEFGYSPEQTAASLESIIRILRARQNAEGAFGFWAANSHVSPLQTVYALHFLTEAKESGYPVPPELLNRGLSYLGGLAGTEPGSLSDARARAYAAYILTRNGSVMTAPIASLRRHMEEKFPTWRKDLAGVYLAASYRLLKQTEQAYSLIRESRLGDPQTPDYDQFYDGLVRDSQLLYITSRHFPELLSGIGAKELERLAAPVTQGGFNTLSGAYTVLALAAYADAVPTPAASGAKISAVDAKGLVTRLALPPGLFPKAAFSDKAALVRFENPGSREQFHSVTTAGFDLSAPTTELRSKVEVQREYRLEGGASAVTKASLGHELEVHLKIRSIEEAGFHNVAVVDLLPGGFEVVLDGDATAPRPPETSDSGEGEDDGEPRPRASVRLPLGLPSSTWQPDYADVREDRVVFFGSVSPQVQEFVYTIRATNKGTFSIPPVFTESMYDRTVQGRGLGGRMVVEGQ